MKTSTTRFLLAIAVTTLVLQPGTFAQSQPGPKQGPASKIYIVDITGESQIETGNKIYPAQQATAYDAPGTVIETKGHSHNSFVYSNGTGMFLDQNTRIEIVSFTQEAFEADYATNLGALVEPSVSHSHVSVSRGSVGVCPSQPISGSSTQYSTPLAEINDRGGRVSIDVNADETHIDLIEGDATVRAGGGKDVGGQVLRPGERATIRPSANAGDPPTITIGPIPDDQLAAANGRVSQACQSRTAVTFELLAGAAGDTVGDDIAGAGGEVNQQKIGAKPVLPPDPTIPVVVSPDRLPGT